MKKINSFILFGVAVFAFAACTKESLEEASPKNNEPVYETLSVKVGPETATRVSLATNAKIAAFEKGDKIAVWTDVNAFQTCEVDNYYMITVDVTQPRSNYAAYYIVGKNGTAPTFDGTDLKITLPSEYDYDDVKGDKNPVPMVAKNLAGDAQDMTFYAVCAFARIQLPSISATADKLVVNFSQDVTGEFRVTSPGTMTPSITTTTKSSKYTVTINIDSGTDYTGAVINIPVPQGNISIEDIYVKNGSTTIQTIPINVYWNCFRNWGKLIIL